MVLASWGRREQCFVNRFSFGWPVIKTAQARVLGILEQYLLRDLVDTAEVVVVVARARDRSPKLVSECLCALGVLEDVDRDGRRALAFAEHPSFTSDDLKLLEWSPVVQAVTTKGALDRFASRVRRR